MTRLLYFTRTQERKRERVFFFFFGMEEMGSLCSSGEENMNKRSFNEG